MRKLLIFAVLGLLAGAIGCGGASAGKSSPGGNTICTPGSGSPNNCVAITVDAGPAALAASAPTVNTPFVTVTVCAHGGTTNCQAIDHVLVDTGSIGFRVLSSTGGGEFSLSLPSVTDASGNPMTECGEFVDSVVYGSVRYADIYVGGESTATMSTTGIPIQVIGDSGTPASSLSCGAPPLIPITDTLLPAKTSLGANGILGIGFFPEDCGVTCYPTSTAGGLGPATSGTVASYPELYYSCPTSGCVFTTAIVAASGGQQLLNPVVMFPTDNNGTIVELPAISSTGQSNVAGSLVFGIGTQSNNALLSSAAVFPTDPGMGTFTALYGGAGLLSYIDSGSNALFILADNSIAGLSVCSNNVFFCNNVSNLSVQNEGNGGSPIQSVGGVNIVSANTLFANNSTAYNNLAGPSCSNTGNPDLLACDGTVNEAWDWGLPFFFGRNVYTSIEGQSVPGGTAPYFAY